MKMVLFGAVLLVGIINGRGEGVTEKENREDGKKLRLRLQVLETLPEPVIQKNSPGAEKIPGGFEGGSSVKVVINGKPEYHFFAHSYPQLDWGRSQLDHWVSNDGRPFRHAGVLLPDYMDQVTETKHIFTAPIPFFNDKENRWWLLYGEFPVKGGWAPDAGSMWCAPSKVAGD